MTIANSMRQMSMRSALLGSALALPMMSATHAAAQDSATSENACIQLEDFSEQIDYAVVDLAEDDVLAVIEAGDVAQCTTFLAEVRTVVGVEGEVVETEQARVRLQDEVVIEGSVVVNQQPPTVEVEEQAAEVSVGSASSDVTVNEGQLDILVRQAAPTVNFEMSKPIISIDQPAPEIIVTMPDPSVDVANARPKIEVRQAEPRVNVTMPDANVELKLRQAKDPENSPGIEVQQGRADAEGNPTVGEPEIAVTRADAQIIYSEDEGNGENNNVNVNRSQPNVRFEQSEPQIQVTAAPEPQVNWTQSGEPTITFKETTGSEETQSASGDAQAAMPGGGQPSANTPPNVRRDGFQPVVTANMTASDMEGVLLYGVDGDNIEEIGELSTAEGDAQEVIADVGGLLGVGERQVRIPMTDLKLLQADDGGQLRAYVNATEDQLMSYPEVE